MVREKLATSDYIQIGKAVGLSDWDSDRYARFMKKRFPTERDKMYAIEWAQRIYDGSDWSRADNETRKALIKVGLRYSDGISNKSAPPRDMVLKKLKLKDLI